MDNSNRGPDRRRMDRRSHLDRRVKNQAAEIDRRSGKERRQKNERRIADRRT